MERNFFARGKRSILPVSCLMGLGGELNRVARGPAPYSFVRVFHHLTTSPQAIAVPARNMIKRTSARYRSLGETDSMALLRIGTGALESIKSAFHAEGNSTNRMRGCSGWPEARTPSQCLALDVKISAGSPPRVVSPSSTV